MAVTEISIVHHVAIVFFLLWLLNSFNYGQPLFYFLALVYLYQVNEKYVMRLKRKLQFEQKRNANQRRVLLESETVRWLNHAIEKIWPVCMEEIVSQKIFLPIIPWFLNKYKPWTIKRAAMEHLYLGRKPPIFTEMRVLHESSDDDHLVMELGLNFLTDDMSAILAAKLLNALGFGIVTKMHITNMHVEGKVLVGVKFIRDWPYVSRLHICFAEPPYFQMTVKPLFSHGIDVTEIPGIAGWLDNLLAVAFEETLVEPNMLVVDMEKFVSPQTSSETENWFSVLAKEPIAYARVEVIEGSEMKPSDLNGLADPYVKGQLGQYRFKTQIQWKTLAPKWQEEFKLPICSWESINVLNIEVQDKDHFTDDDNLGLCSVDINQFKDGARHDMWIPLENIKMGRLHLAITVVQADSKEVSKPAKDEKLSREVTGHEEDPHKSKMAEKASGSFELSKNSHKFSETFEEINIDGQEETGMWIHHPGSEISQTWEPRKGRSRQPDTEIQREGESSSDEHVQGKKTSHRSNIFSTGLHMINNVFRKNQKREDEPVSFSEPVPSDRVNVKAVNARSIGIKFQVEPEDSPAEHQNVKTTAADLKLKGQDYKESSESTKARAKSNLDANSGNSDHQIKHALSSNVVDNESSDEDSVSNEPFLEGVPIPSIEATNDGDSNTTNCTEETKVVARDALEATVEAEC